jgi:outer membrane protein assembly factor BamB
MYISGGRCVEFPAFSDVITPADAGDSTSDAGSLADVGRATGRQADGGSNAAAPSMATSYLANPAHTSAINDPTLVPPLAQIWSVSYTGFSVQYPLVAGGAMYLLLKANATGTPSQLVALDEHSGATLWGPLNLDGLYVAGHAYDRGRVFALTTVTGEVRAFDAKSGAVVWTTTVSGTTEGGGPPTAYNGVLYIGGSGIVVAVDESTGAQLWSTSTDVPSGTSPAVTDDGVFVAGACGEAYALDRATGSVLWHHAPGCSSGFSGTAIVFEKRVYLVQGGRDATVVLDALTGSVLASTSFTNYPALDQGHAFFNANPALDDMDLSSGQNAWTFQGDMGLQSIPFVAGGTVYAPSSTGKMFGVDESTGAQTWSAQADALGGAAPVVGAEGVLVAVLYSSLGVVGYEHVDLPDASVVLGDGAPPTPIVLASGGGAGSLALDGTNVYWTDGVNGEVRKVPKDGGASVVVNAAAGTEPWSVAVDSTHAYWTAPNFASGGPNSAVMSIPLIGGTATTLAAVAGPMVLVANSTNLYWTSSGPAAIQSVPIDGGSVSTVVNDPSGATALAVDAHNLYWCSTDGVYQEPLAGGTALSIGPAATAVAVDGTDVYYVTGGGSVGRVPIGGGAQTVLATGRIGTLAAVAVDGQNVYWIEGEGTIQQGAVAALPKSGGRVAVLASGLSDPSAIVVDDSGIYFTNPAAGGLVEKIAK